MGKEGKNEETKYNKIKAKDNMKVEKEDKIVNKDDERVKLEPILTEKVTVRKKGLIPRLVTGIIGPEGLPGIGSYVTEEIIVPAIKNIIEDSVISGIGIIEDSVISGIRMILHGDTRRSPRSYTRHNPNRYSSYGGGPRPATNYTSRYTSANPEPSRLVRDRRSRVLEEYDIANRDDAAHVLVVLTEQADMYGSVSVADYYDLINVPTEYTDNNYGWTHDALLHAHVRPTRGGYVIKFPTPEVL